MAGAYALWRDFHSDALVVITQADARFPCICSDGFEAGSAIVLHLPSQLPTVSGERHDDENFFFAA